MIGKYVRIPFAMSLSMFLYKQILNSMWTAQYMFLSTCLLAFLFLCRSQSSSAGVVHSTQNMTVCTGASTCGDCLQKGPLCAWCETEDFPYNGESRCDTEDNLLRLGCLNYTMPLTEATNVEDNELSNAVGSANAIQVQPQRVSLKIRHRDTHYLHVKVRQAEDYPVDLYYLMDLSKSMEDDLQVLKYLADVVAQTLNQITSDVRLGFGAFVDKPVLPYVSTVPEEIAVPCEGCEAPYGFRNILALNSNTSLFAQSVKNTGISGGTDSPEGSMDALMQATVCKDEVGWRERARRLIVCTSDAAFHIAGDGRLGGIIKPNDEDCHLDNEGEYADANLYDYPSIGQLNAKMRENNIIPIFAVTGNKFDLYQNLTELIDGSNVAELSGDSSNIVDIIRQNYEEITQKVKLVDTAPAGLELSYSSRCTEDGDFEEGNTCNGLRLGDTVEFKVAITATDCLSGSKNTSFQIQPIGFEEVVTVEVEVICECDCENIKVFDNDACTNGNGSFVCGECICNEGRYGQNCRCSGTVSDKEQESDENCRPANATNVCFGRGECVCGECVCNTRPDPREVISGTYCECDNFSCATDRGELCGGPETGECVCDKVTSQSACKCRPGFQGLACNCPTSQDACRSNNGLICNAAGNCTCGECKCERNSRFQGPRCDHCVTCNEDQCLFHQACLQCKAFDSGRLTKEECKMCLVEVIAVQRLTYLEDARNCSFVRDADDCSINFAYQTKRNQQNIIIYYERMPVCPISSTNRLIGSQDLSIFIGGIVLNIVQIGTILALTYRLWTYIQDNMQYARWRKDQQGTNNEQAQTPIYQSSLPTLKNQTYTELNR